MPKVHKDVAAEGWNTRTFTGLPIASSGALRPARLGGRVYGEPSHVARYLIQKTPLAQADPVPRRSAERKKVLDLASKIDTLSEDKVRERYHELVDKRPGLSLIERFEMERIRARIDVVDFDPQLEARNREWERKRTEVLDSIEDLLDRMRQSQF